MSRLPARIAILGAAILSLLGPARADDCRLTMITSLPASHDAAGGLTVPATLDGTDTHLLVDTAGIYNLLMETPANDMHLSRRAMNSAFRIAVGADSRPITVGAIAHTFKLGNIVAERMQFGIIPDGSVSKGAVGTLGPSVMANYDMEIDPAHGKVNLFSQDHCPDQVVYWTRTAYASVPMRVDSSLHIIVPVVLDGQSFEATVDTGSSTSWLVYDLARGSFNWDESTAAIKPAPNESAGWYTYPFQTLSLSGVDVRNPKILIRKGSSFADRPALIIGMDVLNKLHTFISYSEHKLYFTGANAPPADQPAPAPH